MFDARVTVADQVVYALLSGRPTARDALTPTGTSQGPNNCQTLGVFAAQAQYRNSYGRSEGISIWPDSREIFYRLNVSENTSLEDGATVALSTSDPVPEPVFVDDTGKRRRRIRIAFYALAGVSLTYAALVAVNLLGGPLNPESLIPFPQTFNRPAATTPPRSPARRPGWRTGRRAPAVPPGRPTARPATRRPRTRPSRSSSHRRRPVPGRPRRRRPRRPHPDAHADPAAIPAADPAGDPHRIDDHGHQHPRSRRTGRWSWSDRAASPRTPAPAPPIRRRSRPPRSPPRRRSRPPRSPPRTPSKCPHHHQRQRTSTSTEPAPPNRSGPSRRRNCDWSRQVALRTASTLGRRVRAAVRGRQHVLRQCLRQCQVRAGPRCEPGGSNTVPESIRNGGPIIDTTKGAVKSYRLPSKTIALTFDDGPDPKWTPEVLQVLRKYQVQGTFFVVGSQVARHPRDRPRARRRRRRDRHPHVHPPEPGRAAGVAAATWSTPRPSSPSSAPPGEAQLLLRLPYSSEADAIDDADWTLIQQAGRLGYLIASYRHGQRGLVAARASTRSSPTRPRTPARARSS